MIKKLFSKENLKKFFFSFIWLAVLVFIIDIVTKWVIINHFGPSTIAVGGDYIPVINNFLYITGTANEGAAFSLLNNARWFWIIISVVMSGGLIAYYVIQYKKMTAWVKASLALMIAGAVGNLIDRAFYWEGTVGFNGVVDWIAVWLGSAIGWFPTFNIADASLVIGVLILIVVMVVEIIKEVHAKDKAGEYDLKPLELEKKKKEEEAKKAEEKVENSEENEESKN